MKYVDVNPFFFPYSGGIEHRMHDIARLLSDKGHDVTILTSQLKDTPLEEKTEYGYRVVRLKSRFIDVYNPPFVSSKNVLETLESMDADVVNYNYRWAPSYNKDLAKYDGPKVFTYHNMWGEGSGIQKKFSMMNDDHFGKKVLPTFDHVVCVSKFVQEDIISRGVPREKTSLVPPCLSHPPVPSTSPEGDYILSLGRMVATKGLKYLVEAMKNVDCKLIMCGKGPECDKLKKQISELGLETKIDMRGYVSDKDKEALMDKCKFFVMPSEFESFGLAAVELMSHGRPIVCSDADGLPDTVGDAGIVVPKKNADALSKAINDLLNDDNKRKQLGANAVNRANFFTWPLHIDNYEQTLKKVAFGK